MNRDEVYASMAQYDDARPRKILWNLYWRGSAQLRERIVGHRDSVKRSQEW
jgi:hypothetical protein